MKKFHQPTKVLSLLCFALIAFAQGPPPGASAPGIGPGNFTPTPIHRPSLAWRIDWAPKGSQHPLTQADLATPNADLHVFGAGQKDLLYSTGKDEPPHVWNGMCTANCGLSVREKSNYVDLTGYARIKWVYKAAGFHQIRLILKLADGTWLVGDHIDGDVSDYHESEILIADVRWKKLDIEKVTEAATGFNDLNAPGIKWVEHPDLGKVDEIGWTDLTMGSGHGHGMAGWSDVGWIEVYGKMVKRDGPEATKGK